MSRNPFAYHPAQIAKALVALLTSVIGLLGIVSASLSTGGLATASSWVAGVAVALTAPLVFLKRAEQVADIIDPSAAVDSGE